MSDLTIPDEVIVVACNAYEAAVLDETPRDSNDLSTHEEIAAVRAAVPLIVAAELDRLIGELDAEAERHGKRAGMHAQGTENGLQMAGTWLHRRAAELRGGVSGTGDQP